MTHTAAEFFHLDTLVQCAPPTMPEGPFGRLVSKWADEAVRFVTTEPIVANDGRALATKLRVMARLVEESDGSEFGEREYLMLQAICEDIARGRRRRAKR